MTEAKPLLRALYVEDAPEDIELARRALAGGTPEIALDAVSTLAAAYDKLFQATPAYDVVLTDLRLPDGSGLDLLAHVRARELPLAVVVLTGSGDQESALTALKAGADDYLAKRSNYGERLAKTLAMAVDRSRASRARHEKTLRVLYAEHKGFDIDLTRRHLQRHAPQIRLEVVGSGAEVLERLPATGAAAATYDVILLDYQLPGADALEITKVLRLDRGLDVPIVLVTGQGSEEVVAEALRLGVADYLVKYPGYLAKLPATLEQAHRQAQLQREQAAQKTLSERLNRVLAASPTIVYTLRVDAEGIVPTWVSENITRVLGYAREECLTPDWWPRHVHADDRARVAANMPQLFAEGRVVNEYRFYDWAGGVHRIRDDLRLLRDAAGRPSEAVGSWNDVSAEHQVEERLRLYGAALASSRDAVVITDLAPRILAVNPAFTRVTGYSEAEVVGRNPSLLKSGRQDAAFYASLWASLRETGYWQGEVWNRRKSGELYPQWFSISTVRDARGEPTHYVAVATDLTELRHSEDRLHHLAHYDALTDLPNGVLLELRLEHALERARRYGRGVGVLVIDQDQFKTINDSLGHAAGDRLLLALGERLGSRLRAEDTLARPRGDQFVVVMETRDDYRDSECVARDLLAALDTPFTLSDEHEAYVRASIGISVYPGDGDSAEVLLNKASAAVHRAKELGGHQVCYYTSELNAQALGTLELEAALRKALERGEFVLFYQPKVDLGSGRIVGAEALLRWLRPGHGMVPPLQFIPAAERSGLIVGIGAWVIADACRQIAAWRDAGLPGVKVAVNVSARQFRSGELETTVTEALARYAVEPHRLMLELTESILMERPEEAVGRLVALKKLGVRLSLDDFGTGYSSLGYLSRFPIDQLKIDRSFVTDIVTEPSSAIIATSVIALAHRMGLEVVAEGVETEAQLGYLRQNRCDTMQGYYFSKPVAAADFAEQMRQEKSLPLARPLSTRTLLVVDDEAHILSSIRRLLRGEGYRILTAGSAQEGLEILAGNAVQVVLSDQRMPEMNGTEFLGRVKILHPATVRIVLSGYTELESIMRSVNAGALYKFLTKPWDDDVLREHLRDAFRYYDAVIEPHADAAPAQRSPDA